MKIVITGASGFIGSHLVNYWQDRHDLLLVGRDPAQLARQFPACDSCDYSALATRATGYDALVNLAVCNTDSDADTATFMAVNVDLLGRIIADARTAGIGRIVTFNSFHALDPARSGAYATSKRAAHDLVQATTDLDITSAFLPFVCGDQPRGKLAALARLPVPLRGMALTTLAAFVPMVHPDRIMAWLDQALAPPPDDDGFAAPDPKTALIFRPQSENPVFRAGKTVIDYGFVLAVAVLAGWFIAVCWLWVRLGSPGPGLLAQQRVGRDGDVFTCYKLRTMQAGTQLAGTHDITAAAVTPAGRILRRTKIDELPQIWNIARRQMSLIGPRPCLPIQNEVIAARRTRGVLALRPGISGLAQINNVDMSTPDALARMDRIYLARQSLLLDLKIIWRTLRGGGQGDKTDVTAAP